MSKCFSWKSICLAFIVATVALPASADTAISTEKLSPYGDCFKLSNGTVEVLITKDMGPRIIAYRFVGGENILSELPLDVGTTTELGKFRSIGGHRLWHAPEALPRTYYPDNNPVKMEKVDDCTIRVMPPAEEKLGIQKAMTISLDPKGTKVTVIHEISNVGLWPVNLAPWALSIMRGGGTVIIPQEKYAPHSESLLPARPLVLWSYTDLSDSRFRLGKKYICLSTDTAIKEPTKLGVANGQEWAAYYRKGTVFVDRFPYLKGSDYPDMGSNCETYAESDYIEIETLGPLTNLEPGKSVKHKETWFLFKDVNIGKTDESLDKAIAPLVAQTKG